ncbi:hypothetical protein LJE71_18090 [Xanthobacter autotrophicus]|uniref:hypothetical protein n=1 Tax=Xanthobacter autotrophicus TaxID=280 RepID=UPI001E4D0CBD|nr:hypothetical protein [Xanthobacter autotrophicus]UDQ88165.1 hypothetical protein LJE71_18090 [Xanthobacter autotrophicus]
MKTIHKKKHGLFKTLFEMTSVAVLLFSAASVTIVERSVMTWEILLVPLFLIGLTASISFLYNVSYSVYFGIFLAFYFVLFFAQSVIYESIHLKHLFLYPINMWVAYCFVRAFDVRFFSHLEFLITWLAAISVVIWSLDVVSGGAFQAGLSGISIGVPYAGIVDSYIVFQSFISERVETFIQRNSGFAWEPGAFACFCCLGLMLNLFRWRGKVFRNYGAAILSLGVISSQSTTGYSIFALFIVLTMLSRKRGLEGVFLFPVAAAALVLGMLTLPFMQEKVVSLWAEDVGLLAQSASQSWNANQAIAAQRFLSFQMDFDDFLQNPVTGYGGEDTQAYASRHGFNIVSISGIGKVMSRFGIFGLVFFVWATIHSSLFVNRIYDANNPALLAAFIFMLSVSYSLIEHPLFIAIWAFGFIWAPLRMRSVLGNMSGVDVR